MKVLNARRGGEETLECRRSDISDIVRKRSCGSFGMPMLNVVKDLAAVVL
jgi:hypothetical protein